MTAPPRDARRPRPDWLVKIMAAKRACFDALSTEEKERAAADQRALRQRIKTRRAESVVLARRIFGLHDIGYNAHEIAAIIGRSPRGIVNFAASRGVFISISALVGRRAVILTRAREEALRRMAADYGTSAAKTLDDLLTFSLDEDAAVARRILHVKKGRLRHENTDPLACGSAPAPSPRTDANRDRHDAEPGALDSPVSSRGT